MIYWSVFLSAFGLAYYVFGKRQKRAIPLYGGIGLMFLPYFSSSMWVYIAATLSLVVLSYLYDI